MTALLARAKLIADSVLELPDAERGEKQALGAAERSDSGLVFNTGALDGVLTRPAPARLRFAGATRGLANREVTSVIHDALKKQLPSQRCFPLVRGGYLLQFARSCPQIENWDA
jgi:hypothetical protein